MDARLGQNSLRVAPDSDTIPRLSGAEQPDVARAVSCDPHILGTKILLDRVPYEIIGVMPRDFEFLWFRGS